MPKLFKGTHEILSLAGGTQNVKALYAGNKFVWGEAPPAPYNVVHIGEHDYPYVQIGDLLWLAEDFIEEIGNYLYNETLNHYYYPKSFTSYVSDGWRVPTQNDWAKLKEFVQNSSLKLKSKDMWATPGTDDFRFNMKPFGRYSNGTYDRIGTNAVYWSSSVRNSYDNYAAWFSEADSFSIDSWGGTPANDHFSVRLCKDS